MAKQESIYKIRGKVEGQSYFYSKNGGYQFRKINPTMSERVKTEDAFVNTRKNAIEFGAAGGLASAIVRGIQERYRFITTPKMVGELTKIIYNNMRADTSNIWGRRQLIPSLRPLVQNRFNDLLKNRMPEEISSWIRSSVLWDASLDIITITDNLQTSLDLENRLIDAGATGIHTELREYRCIVPVYAPGTGKYTPAIPEINVSSTISSDITINGQSPHVLIPQSSFAPNFPPFNTQVYISGVLVFFFPYKTVHNVNVTLQHLCTAYWYSISDAE